MAEETVVKDYFSEDMIEAGKKLILSMDEAGFMITAAFWFYLSEENTWILFIASPEVTTKGPRELYKDIDAVISNPQNGIHLTLGDIKILRSDENIIKVLRSAITTENQSIVGIRFAKNTINGVFIQDSFIYRMT